MVRTADEDSRKKAQRLLDAIFVRTTHWPKPTGIPFHKPRPSDVIISTFPKAGTTLLQNMAYQIAVATGGAPSFDPDGTRFSDITEVAPWIDYAPEFGVFECDTSPRIFKTHGNAEKFDHLLTKATYIYCIRNPEEYPASWLDFLFDVLSQEEVNDEEVLEEVFHLFVRRKLLGLPDEEVVAQHAKDDLETPFQLGPWFLHLKGWIDPPRENVLVLFYDDILRDLRRTVLCVARFMNRTLSPEALRVILDRCDRRAMVGNPKFNCTIEARALGFSVQKAAKAKKEDRPGFKQFKMKEEDKRTLSRMMKVAFGVESFLEFQELIRKRQQNIFPGTAYHPFGENGSGGSL